MPTNLEQPIKKFKGQYILYLGLLLTCCALFGDDELELGLDSLSCTHISCALSYASAIICISDIVANASPRPSMVSMHATRRYICNVS